MSRLASLLTAALLAVVGTATAAIPKAAEDEAASVEVGADVPKPKRTLAKPAKTPAKKHVGKAKSAKHGKKSARHH